MFLKFEENPNLGFVDDRVFQERSDPKIVTHILRERNGQEVWCPIVGLTEKGERIPAQACKVEDSGEGTCYLVYGGLWGLRFIDPATQTTWDEAFLLLPPDAQDIRFLSAS